MKTIAICLSLWLAVASCGGEAGTATDYGGNNTATKKIPPNLDRQFNDLLKEFQQKISNDFWTDATTFDMDAYSAYVQQKGLTKIPNSLMDYSGVIEGVAIHIAHKTTSGEQGGWMQQFTIELKQDAFTRKHEFSVTR